MNEYVATSREALLDSPPPKGTLDRITASKPTIIPIWKKQETVIRYMRSIISRYMMFNN